jgi:hypothetical protein
MNDMEYRAGGLPILAITGNQSVDDDEGAQVPAAGAEL